jgi:bacterioferritin-associated ferredoxin
MIGWVTDLHIEFLLMSENKVINENEVVCMCSGTTRAKVRSLFDQGLDAEAISRRTGALSGCGGCEWEIADMLKMFAAEKAGH